MSLSVQTYTLAQEYWQDSSSISVCDQSGQSLSTVPLDFLTGAKVDDALALLTSIVTMCATEPGSLATMQQQPLRDIAQLYGGVELRWLRRGTS